MNNVMNLGSSLLVVRMLEELVSHSLSLAQLIGPPGFSFGRRGHQPIQGFRDYINRDFVHRTVSLNHDMWADVEAEFLRISRTKQTHTRNAGYVGHMQHARIDTDEEVRFGH